MAIRILLAEDHRMIREGLRSLLEAQEDLEVIGEASNGREAVRLALAANPQVVVMDVAMPEVSGIEACRQIQAEAPDIKIVALSMHADCRFVERMLVAGAARYLLKDCAFDELVTAIRSAVTGEDYPTPA
ncbi:MAG: response regulator transcription factor [Armatimonadota bacterium]